MTNYDLFAKHYDTVMGDSSQRVRQIEKKIHQYKPETKTLLELACGTGSILKLLSPKFEKYGLDISSGMLAIAKKKVKCAQFYKQDIRTFKLNKKFDVILCVFDSINHLVTFIDWKKVFRQVRKHLNQNGLFIFDVNTSGKLEKLANMPPYIQRFGRNKRNIMIMDVKKIGKGYVNWLVEVFELRKGNQYAYYHENMPERGFPIPKIKKALTNFIIHSVKNNLGSRPSRLSKRVWFVCQKK